MPKAPAWNCICDDGQTFIHTALLTPIFDKDFMFVEEFISSSVHHSGHNNTKFFNVPCQSAMDYYKLLYGAGCFGGDESIMNILSYNEAITVKSICCGTK